MMLIARNIRKVYAFFENMVDACSRISSSSLQRARVALLRHNLNEPDLPCTCSIMVRNQSAILRSKNLIRQFIRDIETEMCSRLKRSLTQTNNNNNQQQQPTTNRHQAKNKRMWSSDLSRCPAGPPDASMWVRKARAS